MLNRNIVDQFHHDHGFANASTAEQANLATLTIGGKQIDNFNAGFKYFWRCL